MFSLPFKFILKLSQNIYFIYPSQSIQLNAFYTRNLCIKTLKTSTGIN